MFISRFGQEQRNELATLRAQVMELRIAVAAKDSTNDWLMVRVNSLEAERAELTAKLFNVHYPAPMIERVGERPAGVVPGIHGRPLEDGMVVPPHLKAAMRHPAMSDEKPKTGQPSADDEVGAGIGAHQVSSTTFEDMGDEAAAIHGIRHDDDGGVHY